MGFLVGSDYCVVQTFMTVGILTQSTIDTIPGNPVPNGMFSNGPMCLTRMFIMTEE